MRNILTIATKTNFNNLKTLADAEKNRSDKRFGP